MTASVASLSTDRANHDALIAAEPSVIAATSVSGIAQARVIGGLLHVSYYIEQPDTYGKNREDSRRAARLFGRVSSPTRGFRRTGGVRSYSRSQIKE
jgi:hypothetical protein